MKKFMPLFEEFSLITEDEFINQQYKKIYESDYDDLFDNDELSRGGNRKYSSGENAAITRGHNIDMNWQLAIAFLAAIQEGPWLELSQSELADYIYPQPIATFSRNREKIKYLLDPEEYLNNGGTEQSTSDKLNKAFGKLINLSIPELITLAETGMDDSVISNQTASTSNYQHQKSLRTKRKGEIKNEIDRLLSLVDSLLGKIDNAECKALTKAAFDKVGNDNLSAEKTRLKNLYNTVYTSSTNPFKNCK